MGGGAKKVRGVLRGWVFAVAAPAFALTSSGPARAQSTGDAPNPTVLDLYAQAWTARNEGRWDEACTKFRAAMAIDATPTIVINVGDCEARAGKLAAALTEYERARVLNRTTADPARKAAIEAEIENRVVGLKPRIPRVRITAGPYVPGLVVTLDGKEVPIAALGVDLVVDPGKHVVTARAAGHRLERREVEVKEGGTLPVAITLMREQPRTPEELGEAPKVSHAGSISLGVTATVLAGVGVGLGALLGPQPLFFFLGLVMTLGMGALGVSSVAPAWVPERCPPMVGRRCPAVNNGRPEVRRHDGEPSTSGPVLVNVLRRNASGGVALHTQHRILQRVGDDRPAERESILVVSHDALRAAGGGEGRKRGGGHRSTHPASAP